MTQRTKKVGTILVIAVCAVFLFVQRAQVRDIVSNFGKEPVPSAMPYPTASVTPTTTRTTTPKPVASSTMANVLTTVNLAIPFVPQAPHQIWDHDHEEFCEEAAVLMAISYVLGDTTVTNPDVAEVALQKIKTFEMSTLGHFEDTTAQETARIAKEYFKVSKVEVVENPSVADIQGWVAAGRAVVVPTAGRKLGNPNFKSPGPLYHMLVVKGYTANGTFITNDPGTRKGANYQYAPSVIMNAMHDWNGGDVSNGAKVVIVVG